MRGPSRWFVLVAATLAAAVAGAGTAAAQSAPPHSLRGATTDQRFYFVMADRFANGTSANDLGGLPADRLVSGYDPTARGFYHGGDLRGLIRRLDYIKGLGTTAIWLTPSFKNRPVQPEDGPSAGYHGYWITDFTRIDPHLGTNADLAELVRKAHAKGMKVFFDIITNHTADVIQYREGARPNYVSKDASPYRDASGTPFDDRDVAGSDAFPALSPDTSFPYHPFVPAGLPRKVPEWLNDVTNYHNRGNTTFSGENSQYGDFFGLDDLFTEKPQVVRGMIDIYERWVRDFKIDGYRIDTMKHVNDEFWQQFGPEVLAYARAHGVPEFFMFGEVADDTGSRVLQSHYTTKDRMQAALDFPFQVAARKYVAEGGPAKALSSFFLSDDWMTDADSNAYQLPTFLGNHDMGRFGMFLRGYNRDATDRELLARDRLGHALLYFSRGNPVVYYGDEQGFTGDGGDQLARQDMFPSKVPEYNDDDLIGNDATTAESNFDRSTALYRDIARLARVTSLYPALRNGAQQDRYATPDGPGIYAFSRTSRETRREFVVAVNNAEEALTARIPTYAANRRYTRVYGSGPGRIRTGALGRLRVTVPPLSAVVYRMSGHLPASAEAPRVAIASARPSAETAGRVEVRADVDSAAFNEVAFEAKVGDGGWQPIGTDDNAPYRVFHDVSGLRTGTPVAYRATVLDASGHARTSDAVTTTSPAPRITLVKPVQGGGFQKTVSLLATTDPERSDQQVRFERSADGGATWTAVGTDASSPVYGMTDDVTGLGLEPGDELRYRAVLIEGDGNEVVSDVHTARVPTSSVSTLVVHYLRPQGDYAGWGLHLFGDAISNALTVAWDAPFQPAGIDADGARFEIPIDDDTAQACFIIHKPSGDTRPIDREPGDSHCVTPLETPEVWMTQGDPSESYADPTP